MTSANQQWAFKIIGLRSDDRTWYFGAASEREMRVRNLGVMRGEGAREGGQEGTCVGGPKEIGGKEGREKMGHEGGGQKRSGQESRET